MSVKIRLTRIGRIHRPFYRIGVFDSRTARDGKALEYVGHYDPVGTTNEPVRIDTARVQAWLAKGAEVTDQVSRILKKGAQINTSTRARDTARNKARAAKRKASKAKVKAARKGRAKA
jgi:small subunit ribosomal protein S16